MLENTKIWSKGSMELYLNQKPQKVYVTPESVNQTYKDLQTTITNDGSIPIGIDHLPEAVITANPILQKLDLLNVGTITAVDYDNTDDSIIIKEATLTNPLIKELYFAGELDSVSIAAPATVKTCPQNDDVLIVDKTTIKRVDIVGEGACPTCKIPKPSNIEDFVYARKPISQNTEVTDMAEEETITMEAIQAVIEETMKPFNEKLEAIDERLTALEEDQGDEDEGADEEKDKELEAARAEAAEALVDAQIMAGKVVPAQKEAMTKIALADMDSFKALMKDAPVIVDLEARRSLLGLDDEQGEEELSDDEKLIAEVNAAFQK